jgi:regulator of nucleoside diphosphate kinase
MPATPTTAARPPIILSTTDAERLSDLAERMEHSAPKVAGLLLDELERAEVRPDHLVPAHVVGMEAVVEFVDEGRGAARTVQLVYPGDADIGEGKVSVFTPIGAGLIGLAAGQSILWPDRDGHERRLKIVRVARPRSGEGRA